jgi:PAS domain S-box-containing protein
MSYLEKSRRENEDNTKENLITEMKELNQKIKRYKRLEIEHKQALKELKKSGEEYKNIIELAPDSIITFNLKGKITTFNKNFSSLSGYSKDEILNKHFTKIPSLPERDHPKYRKLFNSLTKRILPKPFEVKLIHKNGTPLVGEVRLSLLKRENIVIGFQAIARDITKRKQMEQALRENAEKYRELTDSIADVFFEMDKNLKYTYWNKASETLTGISADEALGKSLYDLFPDISGTKADEMYKEVLRTQQPKTFENEFQLNGKSFVFEINAYPSNRGLSVFVKDITERKKTEHKLKEAVREKSVMLNEIHHRVKNNLQIIVSLLRIQLRSINDEKIREILKISQNRIKSMALIHDSLHRSKDLSKINFSNYVRNMTTHLFSIYNEEAKHVELDLETGEIYIDISRALPCGLIINELVSNSLKHAFPQRKKGKVSIKIDKNMGKQFTLVVSDNGIGLPEGLDLHSIETLGMQLVRDLVKQLDGTLELDRNNGTTFKVTFRN